jgi:hypothetical protein
MVKAHATPTTETDPGQRGCVAGLTSRFAALAVVENEKGVVVLLSSYVTPLTHQPLPSCVRLVRSRAVILQYSARDFPANNVLDYALVDLVREWCCAGGYCDTAVCASSSSRRRRHRRRW